MVNVKHSFITLEWYAEDKNQRARSGKSCASTWLHPSEGVEEQNTQLGKTVVWSQIRR